MSDGESIRLFLAVFPPIAVARHLLKLSRSMRLPDHRSVPAPQVHLTVLFLGDTPTNSLSELQRVVSEVCAEHAPLSLSIDRLGTLPRGNRPRLLTALCKENPALAGLHEYLVAALSSPLDLSAPVGFVPHLTLCRFRRGARTGRLTEQIQPAVFAVDNVAVVRSELSSEGATHTTVHTASLSGEE